MWSRTPRFGATWTGSSTALTWAGGSLVELAEIEVYYGSMEDVARRGEGLDGEGVEQAKGVTEPRVSASSADLGIEMVAVHGGTFTAWEQPEQPVPPPPVVIRGLDGSVREETEEDDDPPEPRRVTVADFAIGAREVPGHSGAG